MFSFQNYAEDTMNELLGWYGYGSEALTRASHQMRRKRGNDDVSSCSSAEQVNIAVEDSDDDMNTADNESLSSHNSGNFYPLITYFFIDQKNCLIINTNILQVLK